jgi:hypothetical protein
MKKKFEYFKEQLKKLIHYHQHLVELPGAPDPANTIKNSLANIPKDKLFISESGYAYNIDSIIQNFGSLGSPQIFIDYLNPRSKQDTILFSVLDIQNLLKFPSVKEAIYNFSSSKVKDSKDKDELFTELTELASLIHEETLEAMDRIYEVGATMDLITKIANPNKYTDAMAVPMMALKDHLDKMGKQERTSLKLFMDRMPYDYKMMRAVQTFGSTDDSLLELDLNDQMQKMTCGSGFDTAMRTLPYMIRAFQNANQALAANQGLDVEIVGPTP